LSHWAIEPLSDWRTALQSRNHQVTQSPNSRVWLSANPGLRGLSERCLARGTKTWSHWKPGLRMAKKRGAQAASLSRTEKT